MWVRKAPGQVVLHSRHPFNSGATREDFSPALRTALSFLAISPGAEKVQSPAVADAAFSDHVSWLEMAGGPALVWLTADRLHQSRQPDCSLQFQRGLTEMSFLFSGRLSPTLDICRRSRFKPLQEWVRSGGEIVGDRRKLILGNSLKDS